MSSAPVNPSGQMNLSFSPERHVYGVSELNAAVQKLFAGSFSRVWVSGEISGCRTAPSGHYYFVLKDKEGQVKCALFKGASRFLRLKPENGLAVAVQGSLEVYSARGEYQLIVERMELHGTGSLQVAFDQLKSRLLAEGLFDPSRKRPLPRFPRKVGIITSLGGAVLHDMLHILERRFPGLHVRVFPAQVQGEGSVEQLCAALQHCSRSGWADVLILARGGGSLEDLWSFNDERLARAIAGIAIPVISAVGHETDFTIADFVADHRAPTPSAAAEIVTATRESILQQITESASRLVRALRYRLLWLSRQVNERGGDGGATLIRRALRQRMQLADDLELAMRRSQEHRMRGQRRTFELLHQRLLETNLMLRFSRNRHREELLVQRLSKAWHSLYWQKQQKLSVPASHLVQLSPLSVLARGYAVVQTSSGEILRSASGALLKEEVAIRLHSGKLTAVVSSIQDES